MKHKNEYKNTQQVQLEPYEQLNMEQYTQYTDNTTITWKTETEHLNMSKTETEYVLRTSPRADSSHRTLSE